MARNPALWIRVPNGGTPDNPAVYTAIRDSLREISEAVRLLQGGPTATAAGQKTTAGGTSLPYTNSGPNIYLPLAGGTLTGLLVTDAPDTASSGFRLPHGTAPSSPVNGDMWTTTSGLYAQINGITVGPFSAASGVYLPLAGGTMTGLLTTVASGTSSAGFNLPHGAAPTTPVNGDLWTTTTGIYARINGTTVGPLATTPTGQALTRVNDTNVTVTLGGSPSTALLAATSLTLGWSGQLSLARGGTGADLSATGGTGQYVKQATAGGAFTVGTIPASDIASGAALTKVDDTNVTLTLGGTPASALLKAVSITAGWSGQLSIARGGTGQSNAVAAFDALAPTTTLGDIIYHDGTDNVRLAGNTVNSKYFLTQTGTGTVSAAPSWGQVAAADIVTGQTLSKVDDTNVTLTLGGTPGSALLKSVSLTLGWTGTLAQTRGGFGANISSVLQNRVYASPDGSAGAPTFRSLVAADIPSLSTLYLPLTGGTMSGNINFGSGVGIVLTDGSITTGGPGTGTIDLLSAQFDYMGVGTAASSTIALNVLGSSTATATTYEDAALIQFRANPATSSTVQFSAIYSSLTAGQSASGAITGRARVIWGEYYNSLSAVTNASALFGNAIVSGTANVTNFTALHAGSPTATSTGRITGYAAGVYIDAQTGGAVTGTAYGLYQAGASDTSYFAGSVGLGTTSPQTRLHLDSTGAALDTDLRNTTDFILAASNGGTGVRLVSSTADPTNIGNVPAWVNIVSRGTAATATAVQADDYLGRLLWQGIATGGGRAGAAEIRAAADAAPGASNVPGRLEFWTAGTGATAERMRIDDAGFVGIGKTPTTIVDILHTLAGSAAVNLSNSSTDPAANARYILNNSATSGGLIIRSTGNVAEPSDMVLYSSANNIRFYTGGNSRASITSTGNFFVDTNVLFVDAASNEVGINTSTPTVALDVVGSAAVSGALTLTTVNLGYTTSGLQLRSSVVGASASTDYFFHRGADSTIMDRIVVHTPNTSGAAFAHMTSGGVTRFLSDGNTGNFVIGTGDAGTAPSGNTLRAPAGAGTNITGGTLTITAGNGTGTGGSGSIVLRTAAVGTTGSTANTMVDRLTLDRAGNVAVGNAALATTATDGFLYIPTCAGVPTGVPTTFTGRVAMVFDTTNNRIYIYDAGWIAFT